MRTYAYEVRMASLQHSFAAGVRFDTELQYLTLGTDGLRYENLPVQKSASPRIAWLTSVGQCVAIVAQMPRQRVLEKLRRAQNTGLEVVDDNSLLRCIQYFDTSIVAQFLPVAGYNQAGYGEIGAAALDCLRAGQMCLLCWASARGNRRAVVIGVESEDGVPRALLLLDSSGSEPWACGHNARITLPVARGRGRGQRPLDSIYPLHCRHLTGEACRVRPLGLVVLGHKAMTLRAVTS